MATTLTIHQRAVRSTVVKKVTMAVTGLIMVAFLLVHMYGNLKMFISTEAFDHYAHWLKQDVLVPMVPEGTFIWIFRAVMVLAIILHIWSAAVLSAATRKNRGSSYVVKTAKAQTYSSRTMRWGGVIILLFLIFHLVQFTIAPGSINGGSADAPHTMVVASFQQWWMVVFYAVCMVLICMHVRHGFWSAFATLGGNTSAKAAEILNVLATIVAVVLYVGFMAMPVAVLLFNLGA